MYLHKTWYQYVAEIYGRQLSAQEARAWYNKIQRLDDTKSKLDKGMQKALENDNVNLYIKLLDKWLEAEWEQQDLQACL